MGEKQKSSKGEKQKIIEKRCLEPALCLGRGIYDQSEFLSAFFFIVFSTKKGVNVRKFHACTQRFIKKDQFAPKILNQCVTIV